MPARRLVPGNLPMNINAQLYCNIKAGVIVSDWSSRIQIQ